MINSDKIRKRLNQVELDISRLKNDLRKMDNTISSGGPIDKGFEIVIEEIDTVREELNQTREEINQVREELNQKLDIILQHITGINGTKDEN